MSSKTRVNLGRARRIYEALGAGDIETIAALAHPDVIVEQDPALPWGGRYVGYEGLAKFFRVLNGTIHATVAPMALYAAGDCVIQHGRTAGIVWATGAPFNLPECHVFTFRDGRIASARMYIDSPNMLVALDQ